MDAMDILPRLVGAFYAFGGWMVLRALLMDGLLEKMLGAITLSRPAAKDLARRWVLGTGGILTSLSGVALILMSRWAVPLFVANLAVQAGWLVWARTAFPPENEADEAGRRSSINAAVGFTAVTGLVLWLDWRGRLTSVTEPVAPIVLGLCLLVLLAWLARHLRWRPGQLPQPLMPFPESEPAEWRTPTRVRLAPRIGDWCLWDADDGRGLYPADYLPPELARRVELWEIASHEARAEDDPFGPMVFASDEAADAHAAEGRAIAAALEDIYGRGNVDGPIYEDPPPAHTEQG